MINPSSRRDCSSSHSSLHGGGADIDDDDEHAPNFCARVMRSHDLTTAPRVDE